MGELPRCSTSSKFLPVLRASMEMQKGRERRKMNMNMFAGERRSLPGIGLPLCAEARILGTEEHGAEVGDTCGAALPAGGHTQTRGHSRGSSRGAPACQSRCSSPDCCDVPQGRALGTAAQESCLLPVVNGLTARLRATLPRFPVGKPGHELQRWVWLPCVPRSG